MLDLGIIQSIAQKTYARHASDEFGAEGVDALKSAMDSMRQVFKVCDPDRIAGHFVLIKTVPGKTDASKPTAGGTSLVFNSLTDAAQKLSDVCTFDQLAMQVSADGSVCLWFGEVGFDLDAASIGSIIIRHEDGSDFIRLGEFEDELEQVASTLRSNFATPTYSNLDEALKAYERTAKCCSCKILRDVWVEGVDGPRLVFVNKPEAIMRDSLVRELQAVIKDASVRPEHNTDETKPVDVVIQWYGSSHSALIEVKWLGRSVAKSKSGAASYTPYTESRARDGAKQLADYLEREKQSGSKQFPKGYLVVFDGRRKKTAGPSDKLTAKDAEHFRHREISYSPEYHKTRNDFAQPIRYFLEPRGDHFLEATS